MACETDENYKGGGDQMEVVVKNETGSGMEDNGCGGSKIKKSPKKRTRHSRAACSRVKRKLDPKVLADEGPDVEEDKRLKTEERRVKARERRKKRQQERKNSAQDVSGVGEGERGDVAKQCWPRKYTRPRTVDELVEEDRAKIYFQRQARLYKLSTEEKEKRKQNRVEYSKKRWLSFSEEQKKTLLKRNESWRHNLTEEKRKRYYESMRKSNVKYKRKVKEERPERFEEQKKKTNEYFRNRWATMCPENKRRRLGQCKIYQTKRKLKKELEGAGLSDEEIQWRLKELEDTMRKELDLGEAGVKVKSRRRKVTCDNNPPSSDIVITTPSLFKPAPSPPIRMEEHLQGMGQRDDDDHGNMSLFDFPSPIHSPLPEGVEQTSDYEDDNNSLVPRIQPLPASPVSLTPNKLYHCIYCSNDDVPFLSETHLRNHLRSEHYSICWKCPKCMEVMISPTELAQHFKEAHSSTKNNSSSGPLEQPQPHHPNLKFTCMRCPWTNESKGVMFETPCQLHTHVKQLHSKYYWPCSQCQILKYSKQSLDVHLSLCQG